MIFRICLLFVLAYKGDFAMNIAIVGGGNRCKVIMELIEKHTFQEITPAVIAVSDINN